MVISLLLLIIGAAIFYILFGYELLLKILSKKAWYHFTKYEPKITVIIPTHNAEKHIDKKLRNLFKVNYPMKKMEVIVVDDSQDKTASIAKKYQIKIIHFNKRVGKIRAINEGLKMAKTEVIVLTDVDTLLDRNSIKHLILPLSNKNIGGVTSSILPRPEKHLNYLNGLLFYQQRENMIRKMEGELDSVSSMDGRLCAFKRSIVKKIDERSLCDDLELAISIRKKGFRVIFSNESITYDKGVPSSFFEEVEQKRRRTTRTIQTIFKNFYGFTISWFWFILFSRRVLPLFLPFFLVAFLVFCFVINYFILLNTFFIFLLILSLSRRLREIFVYFLIVNLGIVLGWLDFLTKGHFIKDA